MRWEDVDLVCPYALDIVTPAQKRVGVAIKCEGVNKHNRIMLLFDNEKHRKMHRDTYCKSLENCAKCPIHQMLDIKYNDLQKNGL